MAITGRTALLTLAGAVPVALAPGWAMLLGWVGVVIALVGIDLALAGRLTTVTVTREPLRSVRLGEPTSSGRAGDQHRAAGGARRRPGCLATLGGSASDPPAARRPGR